MKIKLIFDIFVLNNLEIVVRLSIDLFVFGFCNFICLLFMYICRYGCVVVV